MGSCTVRLPAFTSSICHKTALLVHENNKFDGVKEKKRFNRIAFK